VTLSAIGALAALILGIVSWRATGAQSFYASEVYGMTPRSHRLFALLCLVFACAFGLTAAWRLLPAAVVWALFLIAALLYGTSFLRGYADDDS
jgi:hypothetical protein